jgi:acetyl esterase/lipase
MNSLTRLIVVSFLALASVCHAAEPNIIKLWPGEVPGPGAKVNGAETDIAKQDDKLIAGRRIIKLGNVSAPEMHVLLPAKEKANGGTVLVCPGGGFSILAWDLEGTEVADWLNSLGFAAVVLKYRVPTREHGDALNNAGTMPLKAVGPVMDAQRAMSLTRAHAAEWGLDAKRIGIMGFSAGGETAGLAALLGDQRAYANLDAADEQSCAPNFALLIYPGGFFDKETGGLKPYLKVTKETPPMFFAMAQDDHVNSLNCTALYAALTQAMVPAELHLFTRGGHGYGLRATCTPVTQWPNRAVRWLRDLGFATSSAALAAPGTPSPGNPADHLPPHIQQITAFGERADFSHDGQRVLFLTKQFGDVMECDIATGKIRCLSQHFKHHGFNRAMYLHNEDILLTGPDHTFDAADKKARIDARQHAKGFVLDKSGSKPPTPLGLTMLEGPAVSRTRPLIAWTHDTEGDPRQSRISIGELVYENGVPAMKNVRQLVTAKDFPEGQRPKMVETQNFVPPADKQITITAYQVESTANTDGFLLDLDTVKLTTFTRTPEHYEEIEGVFPDGKSTTVERNEHHGKAWPMVDAWRVWFDGSREPQRLTRFLDFPGYKASNYVVSDDGKLMAFQIGITGDEAGVGYGLFLMEVN